MFGEVFIRGEIFCQRRMLLSCSVFLSGEFFLFYNHNKSFKHSLLISQ